MVLPVDLFFSSSSVSQKNDVAERLCPFDIQKILESEKHAKQGNLLCSV
jgi:hypothetical protein